VQRFPPHSFETRPSSAGYTPGVNRSREALVLVLFTLGCGGEDADEPEESTGWKPGVVHPTDRPPGSRGLLDRRGLIHAHSVYSHDACDDAPRDENDQINLPCLDDFRRGMCQDRHDFVMLTDHGESFARSEYPDVLLYDAARGDALIERDGHPVASWLACPDQDPALVLAGTETETMPVGLEAHVAATQAERDAVYGSAAPEDIEKLKAAGAVSLLQHTESWSVDQLEQLPIDGFEMYNLHANTLKGAGAALELLFNLETPEKLPHSDLVFLPLVSEDPEYLDRWSQVLARGVKRVTTMGTDCHRNTFPALLPDGERVDSYRRMMLWFSNHLLVQPNADGSFDDRSLKDALRAGRLYGAFEAFGYPDGFDFHADAAGTISEMGAEVMLSDGPKLEATAPSVRGGASPSPEIRTVLWRATDTTWSLVTEGTTSLSHVPTEAGVYRAEVRIRPHHLAKYLASYTGLSDQEFVWIYSNPIYVR
jgi:hypothetical protein